VDQAAGAVSIASALAEVMPTFLGGDEPKRHFFAAGSPAELCGAGGFIGAYALLAIEGGGRDRGVQPRAGPSHHLPTSTPSAPCTTR